MSKPEYVNIKRPVIEAILEILKQLPYGLVRSSNLPQYLDQIEDALTFEPTATVNDPHALLAAVRLAEKFPNRKPTPKADSAEKREKNRIYMAQRRAQKKTATKKEDSVENPVA